MPSVADEPVDPSVIAEVETDLRAQLDFVREQMRTLKRQHQRAVLLRQIYDHDPLTRERFHMLVAHIEEYPGKVAELREEERLLSNWLERCQRVREDSAA